jgi:hypothetical protein
VVLPFCWNELWSGPQFAAWTRDMHISTDAFSVSRVASSSDHRRPADIAACIVMLIQVLPTGAVPGDGFAFAGLSLHTTLQEAEKRYPHSLISGHHVYIADADSHDQIRAIDLPDEGPNRRLRVFFERKTPRGNAYPRCDGVRRVLQEQYGESSTVQEFDEERARNRRFVWRRGDEVLSLRCFRFGRQPFSAAELTIAIRGTD